MKKIISILLTIGMLATLFVVPVSAENVSIMMNATDAVLGATTVLDGEYAVFDEVGDSVTFTIDVAESGNYKALVKVASNLSGEETAHHYAPALFVDGVVASHGLSTKDYYPNPETNVNHTPVYLEAGRHTIKVENFVGNYKIKYVEFYTDGTDITLPTRFETLSGHHSTNPENPGAVYAGDKFAAQMHHGSAAYKVNALLGVAEDGVYKVSARVRVTGASIGNVNVVANASIAGNEFTNIPVGASLTNDSFAEITIIENVSLSKGSHMLEMYGGNAQYVVSYWDHIYLTKVEGEPTFTYDTISFYTNVDNATANNGAAKVYAQWTTMSPNNSIEWEFTVPQSGYYTSKLTWNEYIYTYWNPRIFIDGVCYYGAQVVGTGTIVSDPLSQTEALEETTFGTIYLTAGKHTVRVANGSAGYARIHKLDFVGTAPVANAAIEIPADAYDTNTSVALEKVYDGKNGDVVKFTDGANVNYKVFAPESGFYNVGVNAGPAEGAKVTYAVSANGTDGKGTVTGVAGAAFQTGALTGSVYLSAGINDVLVSSTGASAQTFKFIFTPVAWADRVVNVKAAALYDADGNAATAIEANTSYTAVADIAGAYIGKPVTLMVGVYAGGKLVAAHKAEGKTVLGQTIEKTFTTPADAGDYTVKVFMFDGLSTLKPYTADVTVVNPAVAAE